MKPILFRNLITENESFHILEDKTEHFYDFFHYHSEIQLTLIVKSDGTTIIGDNVCSFKAGDIFLLGPEVPHVFLNKTDGQQKEADGVHAISIFFKLNSFSNDFFNLPENNLIKDLLQRSSRGLKFKGEQKRQIAKKIEALKQKKDMERLIDLFHILNTLSQTEDFESVSSVSSIEIKDEAEGKRIERVFRHVMNNFSREIDLEEISAIAYLNMSSFCRFFKQRTRKTFTMFVNEVRVGHACKELLSSNYNVNEVAQRCGFNNTSNFNRKFKGITGLTPSEYIKKIVRPK